MCAWIGETVAQRQGAPANGHNEKCQNFLKKFKKPIDKPFLLWYNLKAFGEKNESKNWTLTTEQQKRSTKQKLVRNTDLSI